MKIVNFLKIAQERCADLEADWTIHIDKSNVISNPFRAEDPVKQKTVYRKYLWEIIQYPSNNSFDINSFAKNHDVTVDCIWKKQPSNQAISCYLNSIAQDIRHLSKIFIVSNQQDIDVLYRCIHYLVNNFSFVGNKLQKGNIVSIYNGLIVHSVNCEKVMGSGLALALRGRYPKIYKEYMDKAKWGVGDTQFVEIKSDLVICNLAGQKSYGVNQRQTDFNAIEIGLNSVKKFADQYNLQIYIPFGFASGKAGGANSAERQQTWKLVCNSIRRICPQAIIVFQEFQ